MIKLYGNKKALTDIRNMAETIAQYVTVIETSRDQKEIVETENMLKKLITRLNALVEGWR